MGLRGKPCKPNPQRAALEMRLLRWLVPHCRPKSYTETAKALGMDTYVLSRLSESDLFKRTNGMLWVTERGIRVYLDREEL
jgi:hypothetical protein